MITSPRCSTELTKQKVVERDFLVKYTRNEWKRQETTLETSGEDVKLHSKRVEKIGFRLWNTEQCLQIMGKSSINGMNCQTDGASYYQRQDLHLLHSFGVDFCIFSTRLECGFIHSQFEKCSINGIMNAVLIGNIPTALVISNSVQTNFRNSCAVFVLSTRLEWIFASASSPLVLSVVLYILNLRNVPLTEL